MDKDNNKPEQVFDEAWLDELLGIQKKPEELGVDESAVDAAGLTKPEDLELEKIVSETLAENWGEEPEKEPEVSEEMDKTQQFVPVEEPEQTPPEAEEPSKVRKVRPAWKKGYGLFGIPHVVSTVVWLVLVMAIGVSEIIRQRQQRFGDQIGRKDFPSVNVFLCQLLTADTGHDAELPIPDIAEPAEKPEVSFSCIVTGTI